MGDEDEGMRKKERRERKRERQIAVFRRSKRG